MPYQLVTLSLFKAPNLGSKGDYLRQTDKQIHKGQGSLILTRLRKAT